MVVKLASKRSGRGGKRPVPGFGKYHTTRTRALRACRVPRNTHSACEVAVVWVLVRGGGFGALGLSRWKERGMVGIRDEWDERVSEARFGWGAFAKAHWRARMRERGVR